jgi:hypothetical protein
MRSPSNRRPEPPRPARFRVAEVHDGVRVSWAWFKPGNLLALPVAAVFAAPLLTGLTSGDSAIAIDVRPAGSGEGLAQAVMAAVWAATVASLGYVAVARIVNRTTFELLSDRLIVTVGPLPWPGTGTWTWAGTRQLFVAKTSYQVNYRYLYRLMAVGRDGIATQIGHAVSDWADVRWLDWLIESRLGIQHDPTMDADRE